VSMVSWICVDRTGRVLHPHGRPSREFNPGAWLAGGHDVRQPVTRSDQKITSVIATASAPTKGKSYPEPSEKR